MVPLLGWNPEEYNMAPAVEPTITLHHEGLDLPTGEAPGFRNGVRPIRGGKPGPTVTVDEVNAILDILN
jgi:hypothetical protein